MKKDLTLVILAAGMGSRFGGLKQVEPIGPNGEFIIDYSVYDAIQAGFSKVVFVIKKENQELFHETIGKRILNHIQVEYAYQDVLDVPDGVNVPNDRVKPWGTGQAVLCCKDFVDGDFVMINSDDFYGRSAYFKVKEFFDNNLDRNTHCMVGFRACNTMTENGSVKRGICENNDSYLTKIVECSLLKENDLILATPLNGDKEFNIKPDTLVSMNFFGFRNEIFDSLSKGYKEFFEINKDNLEKCEYLIPDVVFKEVRDYDKKVKILESTDRWLGVTYKEDKDFVVNNIKELIDKGVYPYDLWK